jgi:hypothetical protein
MLCSSSLIPFTQKSRLSKFPLFLIFVANMLSLEAIARHVNYFFIPKGKIGGTMTYPQASFHSLGEEGQQSPILPKLSKQVIVKLVH